MIRTFLWIGETAITVGERIKKIRIFRKMTMDEFGAALGFKGKSMSVRIAQYEAGSRVPKADILAKIADILRCNYKVLDDYSLGATEDIIETLFWLEESTVPTTGKHFPEYQAHGNLIKLATMTPVTKDADVKLTYNDNDYTASGAPVAVTFEYGLVNDFLLEWNEMENKLKTGKITPYEYFEWKITWPHA